MNTPGDESTQLVIANWIDENKFSPPLDFPEKLQVVLTGQKLPSNDLAIHTAFGIFELQGAFDSRNKTFLKNASLFVVTPGYPRFQVAGGLSGDLSEGKIESEVKVGKFANGDIEIGLESDQKTVSIAWRLAVPFAGDLDDKTYFFDVEKSKVSPACNIAGSDPAALQKWAAYYSGGVDTLWRMNPYDVLPTESQVSSLLVKTPEEAQAAAIIAYEESVNLLESYVDDHFDESTGNFLIDTYHAETNKLASSKEYTVSVSFLGIFELVGSIGKGTDRPVGVKLYVKVPLLGRVSIAGLSGNLRKDGNSTTITATINVKVAKGSVSLILEGKVLYIGLSLDIKLVGTISQKKFKLLTLPF